MRKNLKLFIVLIVLISGFIGYEILTAPGSDSKKQIFSDDNINYDLAAEKKVKEYPNAPEFSLYDLNGNLVKLSDHKGKVVIIDFWATWCGPCRIGIPDFIDIQTKYGKEKLTILGISVDQGDRSVVEIFAKVYKINYPVLFFTPEVIDAYGGIQGIPTTFIVDRQGKIRDKLIGYHQKDYFIQAINRLL
jgi:thiol-disulfide isomerase/thioredoxin